MMHTCPCCGSKSQRPTSTELAARDLPPVQAAILRAMAANFGSYMPTVQIARRVWANDPSGGPEFAAICISQAVQRMIPRIEAHGLIAESQRGRGYRVRAA